LWWDWYKLWSHARRQDPFSLKLKSVNITGSGIGQSIENMPDIRQANDYSSGPRGVVHLRTTNDYIDLSSVQSRLARYKEYERLRNTPEIETILQIFADETCLAGHTPIATLEWGMKPINWLAEHKPDERFAVYCWDFEKQDYTVGWAFDPRVVKEADTIRIKFDNGESIVATPDHRFLMADQTWCEAQHFESGEKLMPFYRTEPNYRLSGHKKQQFPRMYSFQNGWTNERRFIDLWRTGEQTEKVRATQEFIRLLGSDVQHYKIPDITGHEWPTLVGWLGDAGFSVKEVEDLYKRPLCRRVIGVEPWKKQLVYDLSVEKHKNFATNCCIVHNCQKDDKGHVLSIECKNKKIKQELEFLFFHRDMLNIDRRLGSWAKNLFIFGDFFLELILNPNNPKDGILKAMPLPPESMFRIETTKCRVIEFQQSKEGPDLNALNRTKIEDAPEAELAQSTAIRFHPDQIVHMRIGEDRKDFYPYGVSMLEAAKSPAHQLRLMEDSMVVYRLCLAGKSRVRTNNGWKYIKDLDVGDDVYTLDKKGVIPAKVTWMENHGKQTVFKIKSKHIELIGNETHPILVVRDGKRRMVDIKDLQPEKDLLVNILHTADEKIIIPRLFGEKWAKLPESQRTAFRNSIYENKSQLMRECSAEFSRIKQFLYVAGKSLPYNQAIEICDKFDLDPTQLIIANKGEINSERLNLPEFVDVDFARLFGCMIGDGSVGSNSISISTDRREIEHNNLYTKLLERFFGKVSFEDDIRSNGAKLVVSSTTASKIFKAMGLESGPYNKRIPTWVFNASAEIRQAVIEGLMDSDGSIRYLNSGLKTCEFALCNEQLIEDIKEVWHGLGYCSGAIRQRTRDGHYITEDRKLPETTSYELYISYLKLEETETLISVESAGEEDVYDIEVNEDEHNFIVNGTCVHNSRAPERRVFYIDVGQLPPFKAEAFMDRMKDMYRKKKVSGRNSQVGASGVEERWHSPAADEDFWIPIRPNTNTRVESLPGAQNLGEIDDAVYFRNKLYTSLQFPKNYLTQEDPGQTRITLSSQDVRFARTIERLQDPIIDGLTEVAHRHLSLRGYPEELFEDLKLDMTPPSDWRELSRAEVITNRLNNASNLKGSQLYPDYDIYVDYMKLPPEDAEEKQSRMKLQKLEDLKLQVLASNPTLLGIGQPGRGETEMGSEGGGPNPMLGPDMGGGMPPGGPPGGGMPPPMPEGGMPPTQAASDAGPPPFGGEGAPPPDGQPQQGPPPKKGRPLPSPEKEDIKKYDLEIQDYESEMDHEDVDYSEN